MKVKDKALKAQLADKKAEIAALERMFKSSVFSRVTCRIAYSTSKLTADYNLVKAALEENTKLNKLEDTNAKNNKTN